MNLMKTSLLTLPLAIGAVLHTDVASAKQVIVELDDAPGAHYIAAQRQQGIQVADDELQAYRNSLSADQDAFLNALTSQGVTYSIESFEIPDGTGTTHSVDARYTLVFNGIGLDVPETAIGSIKAMPGVKDVHPVRMHRTSLAASVPYIGAPELYGSVAELGPFDDLREGLEGQGLNVSVIDTGIEWSHEMFGGDATPPRFGLAPHTAALNTNEKVTYYLPLFDAVVDTFGHGTHVASTAAGYLGYAPGPDGLPLTADDEEVHGVAPQARLMGYQVCNGTGSASGTAGCLSTAIMLALEDSVSPRTLTGQPKPVAHVINLSLGGSGGPDDASSNAADNAALTGAIVVAAAGNDGPGASTLGSPAAGQHVIAVAASNDPGVFPNSIDVLGAPVETMVATMSPDSNAGLPLNDSITGNYVFAGLADTPDQVPAAVLGNICLVQRGSTAEAADNGTGLFANKAANCEAKGAIATVVYNNEPGQIGGVLAPATRPFFTTSDVNGQTLLDLGFNAAGISNNQISLNPPDETLFDPMITGFSSRGPVQGLGQIKPDVAAPGEAVMAATTPIGVPVLSMQSETRYISANGTSMATPHVAGAATLVKQAHLDWTPDMIRTALMNTATNPRDRFDDPETDGPLTNDIMAQGAGLIDVYEAVHAKALMGIAGDGITVPGILGSHSFGEAPVINSRVTHTESVQVELRDLSGEGGTYDLTVGNNRDLQLDGLDVNISPASITVPAGGRATFTVNAVVDGDVVRDRIAAKVVGNTVHFEPIEMMWFVNATRSDGAELLRMPFWYRPTSTVPASVQSSVSESFTGLLPASDTGLQLVEGVTYLDFEVDVTPATFNLVGDLSFDDLAAGLPDLDLFLLDPNGNEIASSTTAGGPEHLSARTAQAGTYTFRVVGWLNAPTEFELVSTQELGGEAPTVNAFDGDFVDGNGDVFDFDGDVVVSWTPKGNPLRFEVEHSVDGGAYELIAEVDGSTTELVLEGLEEGEHAFRVTSLFPGQIGYFVSKPSDAESVIVDRREQANITNHAETSISNVSFAGGVFEFDLDLTNTHPNNDYLPLVEFKIVKITSGSGTVEVINADNGGDGTHPQNAALFDYSDQLGSDSVFSVGETTGTRHLQFADPAAELFT
ncbi:MAG: S8 family serine peptidase, partial [Xanthomonadales bacterium]|nr:S8 family serine peptidase [Xanthomonadales bacterium]